MTAFVSTVRRGRAALPLAAFAAAACFAPGSAHAGVALSTSGWEWSDPAPQGYSLYDVKFSGQRGYAVGAGGTALRSDDGGANWSGLFTGTSTTASSLDLITPDAIAIATGDGNCTIRLTDDGGAKFKVLPVAENEFSCADDGFLSYDFVSPTTGYVLRKGGGVITTTNGGETFGSRSAVDGGVSIQFASDQVGFAASANGKIYKTTDGAQTWNPIHDAGGALSQIRLTSANDIVAWGPGRLVRSTDGGATFTPGSINGNPSRVSWSDPSHLAFISDAKLLLSADGGATVNETTIGNKDVNAVAYVDGNRLVAVGNGGVTYTSSDAGANFSRLSSDRIASSFGSLKNSPGGPIAIGGNGTIGRVVDGKWVIRKTTNTTTPVRDADFSSASKGYVLQGNSVHQTTDNGATWKPISTGAPSSVSFISTPDDDTVLVFGAFGVLRATNGGAFDKVEGKLVSKLKPAGAHTVLGRVTTWTTKAKAKPLISVDGGESWKAIALPKGITRTTDIQPLPNRGLLLNAGGRLFRSTNDTGKKWTEITSLATDVNEGAGITVASSTEYFAGVNADDWGVPVVLHTIDSGKTWQPQAIGATNTFIKSLVAGGPKTGYVLSGTTSPAENAIFATINGGSRGNATTLSLSKTPAKLKRSAGKIQINGQLTGGTGGETVHVAIRKEGSSVWTHSNVIVGANGGGSFTATLKASKGKYVAVAQWAGDSGRAGTGTTAKAFTITK